MGASKSYRASFGRFLSKNQWFFTGDEPEKFLKKQEDFMRTGISKKNKVTNIYFNEAEDMVEICTYNTALKNRLTEYIGNYPSEGKLTDDDGNGCLTFEIKKGRFGFKLTAPYSEERKKAASDLAKKNTEKLRRNA